MTPDTALAPSTHPSTTPSPMARSVSLPNHQRAVAAGASGLIEILRFGALMIRIDNRLGGGNNATGTAAKRSRAGSKNSPRSTIRPSATKAAAVGRPKRPGYPDAPAGLMEGDRAFEDDYAEAHARVME